jgi:uncharacterized membrane protein
VIRSLGRHVRLRLVSGLFVLVPLGITIFVVRALFLAMAGVVRPFVEVAFPDLNPVVVTVISVVVFILTVYAVGCAAAYLLGKQLIAAAESLILKVPVVKSIYALSKQVIDTFSPASKHQFKAVVLVAFPRPGLRTLGFVTGTIRGTDGREWQKIFVPTAPNPTTGFVLIAAADEVQATSLTVEEAIKMIISGGVLAPDGFDPAPRA